MGVAQQALAARKRDSHVARIIMSNARKITDDSMPADEPDETVHSSLNLAPRSNGKAHMQRVVASTRKYLRETRAVTSFKENLFECRFPAVLGTLLLEDSSVDKLKTTFESLATDGPCSESSAHRLRAMSAKLDDIKGMQDQCSSVIDRLRLIPGSVAFFTWKLGE